MAGVRPAAIVITTMTLVAIASCSLTHSPSPSKTFDVNWQIQQPTRTTPEAELFLTDTGLWGYRTYDREQLDEDRSAGDLVVFKTGDAEHIFVVVDTMRHGHLLQRLDDQPISSRLVGRLHRLTAETVEDTPRLCLVDDEGELLQRCDSEGDHHRWNLFELSSSSKEPGGDAALRVRGDFSNPRRSFGLPVSRRALAGADALTSWLEAVEAPSATAPLIAIGAHPRLEATLGASVAYEPACLAASPASELVDAFVVEPDDHGLASDAESDLITVEDATLRLGVDTIATCYRGDPLLMVPAFSRPLLRDDRGQFIAPPGFGMRPRRLTGLSVEAEQAWVRAAALVAVGDVSAASFWIEKALSERPGDDSVVELALASTSVLASAGHPELAIHIGGHLTDSAWDPRNIPDHLDGLIVLLGVLDQRSDQRALLDQRENLARRHYDDHRLAWHSWADLRITLANRRSTYGRAYDDLVDQLQEEGLDGWALAIWATLAMDGAELPIVEDADVLDPLFADFGAQKLWSRLKGDTEPTRCADLHFCVPTTYGWVSSQDHKDPITGLSRLAPNELSRGFNAEFLAEGSRNFDDHHQRLALWLSAIPLAAPGEVGDVTSAAIRSLDTQFSVASDRVCDDPDPWRARFASAAARARLRPGSDVHRRTANFLTWWSSDGVEALCAGPDEFLDALESSGSELREWASLLTPLLERQVRDQARSDTTLDSFRRTAEIAGYLGDADACVNWHLAISVATTRARRFDEAERHLVDAAACLDDADGLAPVFHVVSAYLDFERGAGHSVLTDGRTERAIDRATSRRIDDPDTCVGLLPLDFRLDSQLPDSLVHLVQHLALEPAPYDDFGLLTATSVMNRARSAYVAGLRDLQRGQWLTAALAIEEAQRTFSRLEHLPGLARIEFLDETIYGGKLHELVDRFHLEPEDVQELLRQLPQNDRLLEDLRDGDPEVPVDAAATAGEDFESRIAALLISRQDDRLREIFGHSSSLPSSLCDPDRARRVLHVAAERAGDDENFEEGAGVNDDE